MWLSEVRNTDPRKLAFFTGRDQSQALTGWWATQFGTPNYAAHGGFCSVNMAAAGLYTFGGSFWEFGEPDWKHTKYFLLFGVAEDHASNPIKIGLGKLKERGVKFVSVNPVRTGYSAIADEWIGIRPGTDGLFAGALIHCLIAAHKIDLEYLARYTNATWLVMRDPGIADHGLFVRNASGSALVWDGRSQSAMPALSPDASPKLMGEYTLAGRPPCHDVLPVDRRALSVVRIRARSGRRTLAAFPPHTIRRIAAELADVAFDQQIALDIPWTDYAGRYHRQHGRPAGFDACHARHLRPFQRLPDLPHLASAADHPRHHRCAGRLSLQGAVSRSRRRPR